MAYDPLAPPLSDIPDAAKPYAGFLLGLVKCYTETDDEHEKKTLDCVALYHLHFVFDGLARNNRGKDAKAKASEVLGVSPELRVKRPMPNPRLLRYAQDGEPVVKGAVRF
ncbi:hypothetical protein RUND412_007833 [Rhizina undulata]